MRLPCLTLTLGLHLLLAVASIDAQLAQSLSESSNEPEYYLAQGLVPPLPEEAPYLWGLDNEETYLEAARGSQPLPRVNVADNRVEYLINNLAYRAQPREVAGFQKLLDTIEDLAAQENEDSSLSNELNKHLPMNTPYTTEGPINNPMEFEAAMSQLTNALNHGIPNTSNRSAVLDSLLSSFMAPVTRELQSQQRTLDLDDDTTSYNLTRLLNHKADNDNENEIDNNEQEHGNKHHAGSEYIDHPLALIGHQYVQGGAGEGRQLLGPDGSFENVQVIKSDRAVPSYCDPPNPCPIGYTAEDGCLEKFVNSASFSREYQVKQKCSCDNEHSLFNCGSPTATTFKNYASSSSSPTSRIVVDDDEADNDNGIEEPKGGDGGNKLDTLARAIQNRYGNLESIRKLINEHEQNL